MECKMQEALPDTYGYKKSKMVLLIEFRSRENNPIISLVFTVVFISQESAES